MRSHSNHEFSRYLHCNMRLRTRYGLEMSIEEFRELCDLFKRRNVVNLRTTELGDLEGWVNLRGTWVCGHFKPREGFIASFMPAPPPAPILDGSGQVLDVKSHQRFQQHMKVLEEQRRVRELDVAWFKARMHDARQAIRHGLYDDAVRILEHATSLPKGAHPGRGLDDAADSQVELAPVPNKETG